MLSSLLSRTYPTSSMLPVLIQQRFKKKRKKGAKFVRTPEQEIARGKAPVTLQSRLGNPETPFKVATEIKRFLARVTARDKTQIRRKKDHRRYNVHRYLSTPVLADPGPSIPPPMPYVTPLTKLQDSALLEEDQISGNHRFEFPHVFKYQSYFGPPSVQDHNITGHTTTLVTVSFKLSDLKLTYDQSDFLKEVIGHRRYDKITDVVTIEGDIFNSVNENAAYLGDLLESLIKESKEYPGTENNHQQIVT
jgi:Mitochondrial ribosomal subunit protein